MKDDEKKARSKLNKNDKTEETESGKISEPEPVEGYFKAGENSVVKLSCKTQKLARILEEKSHLEKNKKN